MLSSWLPSVERATSSQGHVACGSGPLRDREEDALSRTLRKTLIWQPCPTTLPLPCSFLWFLPADNFHLHPSEG